MESVWKEVDETPLVSVIIPTYNCASFIAQAIRSVQKQTYENWEIIAIDDCSSDTTRCIIEEFARNDERIKMIILTENRGAAEARNVGLAVANGNYIAFLDGDDMWRPEKLMKQLHFMIKKDIGFSFTGYCLIGENAKEMGVHIIPPPVLNYKELVGNTIIGCLTVMLDRRKIGNVQMPNVKPEDTALWLSLLRNGHQAYGIQEVLADYRIVYDSVSRNKIKAAFRYWKLLREQEKLNPLFAGVYFTRYALNAYMKNKRGTSL
ncbi:glycosyltransferase family 2 protein [Ectobacillus antri]|jgi:teichuronic acid biosynthesis glycosyltransferase TuaG|uniref:Glycosyltransferase family 2 protein n=1 Tax=Ectobacillus antri TaxID=2486280 RepID=A0ABT6H323_9BACI|nr:glycosyltransferase family 2 protein [Ectobacillus antri]MDG4656608.1 glycosyltransferase family 2 protein [Ectobacillus antri]MDG5753658.1 glycosyltransferase family 2 protein [Ectobacillus antri]